MEKTVEGWSSSFPIGETAQERGFSHVPDCYKVQPSQRACLDPNIAHVPVVNLEGLTCNRARRSIIIEQITNACRSNGFFHVVNHGIPRPTLDGALSAASAFFNLPVEAKDELMSNDVHKPLRYGTRLKDGEDKVQFWRMFLKHYANPLRDWIGLWPRTPADYREKMGEYAVAAQELAPKIMGAITESLGLGPSYMAAELRDGAQVVVVNCYPRCPQPELSLGLPPHSDYSCLTILLQDSPGLQILDFEDGEWKSVPVIEGALQVHVGDHLEVLSNGRYKSVVHKVKVNSENTRISIVSLHSLGMDEKMEVAIEMLEESGEQNYKGSSFRDFLEFISENDIGEGKRFLDSLKIKT